MDLVEVAKLPNDSEALVVRSLLESHGIRVVSRSPLVQSVHPITVDGAGIVRILVRPEDADRARAILDENDLPRLVAE
jgi:hypothetical protein